MARPELCNAVINTVAADLDPDKPLADAKLLKIHQKMTLRIHTKPNFL